MTDDKETASSSQSNIGTDDGQPDAIVDPDDLFPPPRLPDTGIPSARAAYSDRTAVVMAQFAQLAYIKFEEGDTEENLLRTQLEKAKFSLLRTYKGVNKDKGSRDWGTQAFIALGDKFNVLVFRGSTDFRDWRTNFNILKKKIYINQRDYVRVHRGFWAAYNFVADDVVFDLNHHAQMRRKPLYITGHSLGGALAQIAAAHCSRDDIAACYSFGAPRVGNLDFDRIVKPPHYRVTNNFDIVPGIPFYFMGYRHSGDPRHIKVNPLSISRHDIFSVKLILVDTVALFGALFLGKSWGGFADHKLSLYIERLREIAKQRESLTTFPKK